MYLASRGDLWTLQRNRSDGTRFTDAKALAQRVRVEVDRRLKCQSQAMFLPVNVTDATPILELKTSTLENVAMDQPKSDFYPLLSFHATQDVDKVQSIAAHGFVVPGDLHPATGNVGHMANGAIYGEGVYTSTDVSLSHWFSFLDRRKTVQLVVSLIFPGTVHFMCDDPPEYLSEESRSGKSYLVSNPDWDQGLMYPVHGTYANGAHTRMSGSLDIIVSGSASYVVPVFILTLQPKWGEAMFRPYLQLSRNGRLYDLTTMMLPKAPKDAPQVKFFRFAADLYAVRVPASLLHDGVRRFRHHVVLPLTAMQEYTAQRAMANFIGSLRVDDNNQHHVLLYDSGRSNAHWVHNADDFSSCVQQYGVARGGNECIVQQLVNALKSAAESVEKADSMEFLDVVYVFIDSRCTAEVGDGTTDALLALVDAHRPLLKVKRCVIKLVFLQHENYNADDCIGDKRAPFYTLKTQWQTETLFEEFALFKDDDMSWEDLCQRLLSENGNIECASNMRFAVPFPLGVVGEGFVLDFSQQPAWDVTSGQQSVLYKGRPSLPCIWIGDTLCHTQFVEGGACRPEDFGAVIALFCEAIVRLLCRFRLYVVRFPARFQWYEATLTLLCTRLLEELGNAIQHPTLSGLCDLGGVRRAIHHVTTLSNEMTLYAGVRFGGKWFDQVQKMRFGKQVIKRVKNTFFKGGEQSLPAGTDVEEVLAHFGARGVGIRVRRTAASDVEPWRIVVEHVSHQRFAANQLVVGELTGTAVYSSLGPRRRVTDVVLEGDLLQTQDVFYRSTNNANGRVELRRVSGPQVARLYHGFVFTRSPYLYMNAQPYALLAVTWVRAVETVFRHKYVATANEAAKKEQSRAFFTDTVWPLAQQVAQTFGHDREAQDWLCNVLSETTGDLDALSSHLTTKNNVQSMCRLLAVLMTPGAKRVIKPFDYTNDFFRRMAFLMLAETTARAARVCQRRFKTTPSKVVRKVMALDAKRTVLSSYTYDIDVCAQRSNAFFQRRYANCTPFSVVATLGFIQRWHRGDGVDVVWNALFSHSDGISMRDFLATCFPAYAAEPRVMQLALFLHSNKYHDARFRHRIDFSNPRRIIDDIVGEEKRLISHEQAMCSASANRRDRRLNERLYAAEPFRLYHPRVRLFTESEVAELNAKRPPEDRLERLDSGLLRFHCCYPDCPDYLKMFQARRSEMSVEGGTKMSRQGLMQHLRHDHALHFYVPSFHLHARLLARTCSTFEAFNKEIRQACIAKKQRYDAHHIQVHIRDAWDFWRNILDKNKNNVG